jgi:hypothetical protein
MTTKSRFILAWLWHESYAHTLRIGYMVKAWIDHCHTQSSNTDTGASFYLATKRADLADLA